MNNITASMVKELRERTGVGMAKCKDALVRAEGSIEGAIDILRKEGMASAVKKEGRETKEGVIAFYESDDVISLIEVNCETDFVAKNEKFKIFAGDLAKQVAKEKINAVEELSSKNFIADSSITVEQYRNLLIQEIGENIQIKRLFIFERKKDASYGIYSHMGGKIVTISEISGSADVKDIAKNVAMHIAASSPEYLNSNEIPEDVIAKEKEIAKTQVKNKPANIIDQIVNGKLNAFYTLVCLEDQPYIKDSALSVEKYVSSEGKKIGKELTITKFLYWKIGQ